MIEAFFYWCKACPAWNLHSLIAAQDSASILVRWYFGLCTHCHEFANCENGLYGDSRLLHLEATIVYICSRSSAVANMALLYESLLMSKGSGCSFILFALRVYKLVIKLFCMVNDLLHVAYCIVFAG